VVAKRVPDLADGTIQCLLASLVVSPDLIQQRLARDEFAGHLRETQEHFDRLGWQVAWLSLPGNPSFERLDEQVTEIEAL
jgi:hypothetical protein